MFEVFSNNWGFESLTLRVQSTVCEVRWGRDMSVKIAVPLPKKENLSEGGAKTSSQCPVISIVKSLMSFIRVSLWVWTAAIL